ncbi:Pr6Pr family membrane protein [Nocardioides limicola]|uniref:Pr6Pr family membrane protein n=1 Tax=Nocardioides limicola TaxID=2803368 RepID=UPI00193C48E7|nr:Pr6Pr family membrane protein [Nocardioides sp. DJM-14]
MTTLSRLWHAVIALIVLGSLVIQIIIAVEAPSQPPGHEVGLLAGAPLAERIVRVFSFFTIQSNILCGIVAATLVVNPDRDGPLWRPVRVAAVFGITVTGIVYATILAAIHTPVGWMQVWSNAGFHYVVPVMTLVGWLIFGPRPRVDRRTIALAMLWPIIWTGYTLLRGAATQWYPYPFIDVAAHGYSGVAINIVAILLGGLVLIGIMAALDRALPATGVRSAATSSAAPGTTPSAHRRSTRHEQDDPDQPATAR